MYISVHMRIHLTTGNTLFPVFSYYKQGYCLGSCSYSLLRCLLPSQWPTLQSSPPIRPIKPKNGTASLCTHWGRLFFFKHKILCVCPEVHAWGCFHHQGAPFINGHQGAMRITRGLNHIHFFFFFFNAAVNIVLNCWSLGPVCHKLYMGLPHSSPISLYTAQAFYENSHCLISLPHLMSLCLLLPI